MFELGTDFQAHTYFANWNCHHFFFNCSSYPRARSSVPGFAVLKIYCAYSSVFGAHLNLIRNPFLICTPDHHTLDYDSNVLLWDLIFVIIAAVSFWKRWSSKYFAHRRLTQARARCWRRLLTSDQFSARAWVSLRWAKYLLDHLFQDEIAAIMTKIRSQRRTLLS